MKTIHCLS